MADDLQRENKDLVSQREYFERWLVDCRSQCARDDKHILELLGTRLDSMQANVAVAKEATDQHFKLTNEWRVLAENMLNGKASTDDLRKVEGDIAILRDTKANTGDLRKTEADIRILRESKATLEGKASQGSVYIGYMIGLSGLLLAGIALIRG